MSKQTAHLFIGSFVISIIMACFGLTYKDAGFWAVFIPVAIWYATKPERSA